MASTSAAYIGEALDLRRPDESEEVSSGVFPKAVQSDRDVGRLLDEIETIVATQDRRRLLTALTSLINHLASRDIDLPPSAHRLSPKARTLGERREQLLASSLSARDCLLEGLAASTIGTEALQLTQQMRRLLEEECDLWLDAHYVDLGVAG